MYFELKGSNESGFMIIGAHFDSAPGSPGVDDNGSGCVALLQLLRLLHAYRSNITYSIIFALFDYSKFGYLGSDYFVQSIVAQRVKIEKKVFIGAIILDSIMNYQTEDHSQGVPFSFQYIPRNKTFKAREPIENQTMEYYLENVSTKGNFIAIYGRAVGDSLLLNSIQTSQRLVKDTQEFKTLIFHSSLPFYINQTAFLFDDFIVEGDQMSFWSPELKFHYKRFEQKPNVELSEFNKNYPAILVTDTSRLRYYQSECNDQLCDNGTHLTDINFRFMYHTIKLITLTALDLVRSRTLLQQANRKLSKPERPVIYKPKPFEFGPKYLITAYLTTIFCLFIMILHILGYWKRLFDVKYEEEPIESEEEKSEN
ncbi:uncharacterized protein B4U79_17191 [Dinothrombium tinctorium]|uniref:Peptidase M28 domain-containing protein n=1 Tax=Dinothrombium tinctorium TaxID=1965070 RepID=A0A3S4RH88_9ACAR|nr:uncharacterized protein B4U79_17191 [Dinothrombium tinctorium]